MEPTKEDLKRWQEIAKRRNSILPVQFQFLSKKDISITCGNNSCGSSFVRPLILGQNDPTYVCPNCQRRNYIPIDWNVTRKNYL